MYILYTLYCTHCTVWNSTKSKTQTCLCCPWHVNEWMKLDFSKLQFSLFAWWWSKYLVGCPSNTEVVKVIYGIKSFLEYDSDIAKKIIKAHLYTKADQKPINGVSYECVYYICCLIMNTIRTRYTKPNT